MVRLFTSFVAAALMAGIAVASGSAGALDTTFDADGVARSSDAVWVAATVVQSDGKVLVAGTPHASQLTEGGDGWLFRRYTASGALDSTFGSSGEATPFDSIGGADGVRDMILDGSGRVLATGEALVEVLVQTGKGKNKTWVTEQHRHAVVIRLTSAGALDSSFGDGGVAILESAGLGSAYGRALALQSDGRIVVVGTGLGSSGGKRKKGGGSSTPNNIVFVTCLATNGSLDAGFGSSGYATKDLGFAIAVAVQSNDEIVVGSRESDAAGAGGWALHRYDEDGALDSSFGTLLSPESGIYYGLSKIAIDSSNRILASGLANDAGDMDGVVVRYGANGALDTSFGSSGTAHTGILLDDNGSAGLAIQGDGKILLAGTVVTENAPGPPDYEAYIVRFTSTGSLDTVFGSLGYGQALPLTEPHVPQALALTPAGDVVVAGIIEDFLSEANREMFVARWCGG